ncbi:MAG: primosomal protein N', partial [Parvularculaceae bacterium]
MGASLFDDPPLARDEPARAKVLFPLPLDAPYDYAPPADAPAPPVGAFVRAPLGPRARMGVVWPAGEVGDGRVVDPAKLRAIEAVAPAPPLPPSVLDFVAWTARYAMAPVGSVLRLVMRGGDALDPPRPREAFALAP